MRRASKAIAILQGCATTATEVSRQMAESTGPFLRDQHLRIAHLTRNGFDPAICTRIMADVNLVQQAWASLENREPKTD
jgi:hypothetical protein